ncbi:flagellar basal body rod protein FlgB [Advenella alkanexedens]|uniref:Flagellar basal body rod protein FlgB n=1 Tax=Advenella alkanexedens TaxID=1481665 RepID=A0ABS6NPV2_9BURK|nr:MULTISPECIES: flagellar basal body rod protein FlgB [Advenella]MBV4397645.1 flagellar basal body rod protein FlgB [Advenella alkanexedens]MDD3759023.1 flagellar basal body rod protein FlgB [Advenella sp.]
MDRIGNEFKFLQTAVGLRQQRMELLSTNIANADTPNYKARDFSFKEVLAQASEAQKGLGDTQLTLTSARHIPAAAMGPLQFSPQYRLPTQNSLDGNTVEMDMERVAFADNTMQYQATLTLLNGKIKSMLSALQPN